MWLTVRAPLRVRPRAGTDLPAAASAVAVALALADGARPAQVAVVGVLVGDGADGAALVAGERHR